MNREELWESLNKELITTVDQSEKTVNNPWYIKLLLGFAGWIGASFLLSCLGITLFDLLYKRPAVAIIIGLAICLTSYILHNRKLKNIFLKQLVFASTLAGQGVVIYGLITLFDSNYRFFYLILFIFSGVFYYFINSTGLKLLSSLTAAMCLSIIITSFNLYPLVPGLLLFSVYFLWKREFQFSFKPKLVQPLAYALTAITLITIFGEGYIWKEFSFGITKSYRQESLYYIGFSLNLLLIAFIYFNIFRKMFKKRILIPLLLSLLVTALGIKVPGIIILIPILLLGFNHSNKIILFTGIVGILAYLSHYYYKMEITLLIKSVILMSTGAALLITRIILIKRGILCQKN